MSILNGTGKTFKETNKQALVQSLTLINTAFALVAGLAWNEAIKSLIDRYLPATTGLYSKFAYAFVLTLVVVTITRYVSRLMKNLDANNKEAQS
jgi:hypothetical protein